MSNILRYEPHAHTSPVSVCASLSPRQMVEQVKAAGYDAVIVTDHYNPDFFRDYIDVPKAKGFRARLHEYYAGYRAAKEAGEALGLLVLPALELRVVTGPEDYLIYGIDEETLGDFGCLCALDVPTIRKMVDEAGGLLYQAHPFRGYCHCMPADWMDGVEIINENPRHDSHNESAMAFAKENGLLTIAGTDVHDDGDAGRAGIYLPLCTTVKELVAALKAGQARCFLMEEGKERVIDCL